MTEKNEDKKVPVYEFVETEGVDNVNPYKRRVSKTMEVTEMFTPFDAMTYVHKMKKQKKELEGQIEGLDAMIKAYEDELEIIEKKLGLKAMEDEFIKKSAEKITAENAHEVVEAILHEETEEDNKGN